jgi:hypothetical protein
MKIKQLVFGKCAYCETAASKEVDGVALCSHCADIEILKNIKKCIAEITHAKVTIKIIPIQAVKNGK